MTAGTKKGEVAAITTGLLLLVGLGKASIMASAREHSREHLDALSSFARLLVGGREGGRCHGSFGPNVNAVILVVVYLEGMLGHRFFAGAWVR